MDCSLGFQYRRSPADNVIVSVGFGTLLPGAGFRDIYRRTMVPVSGYTSRRKAGETDDFLYSAIVALTLTY